MIQLSNNTGTAGFQWGTKMPEQSCMPKCLPVQLK